MKTLLIATSSRSTWITAPDPETAIDVRALLEGSFVEVRRRGQLDACSFDVGIGTEALEAGAVLIEAGYAFEWHDDQHQHNREGTAWGIPVQAD